MRQQAEPGSAMIDAPGTVTALDGEYAVVRMDETGCGRCHEPGGCGGQNIGKMFCSAPRVFRVLNPKKATIGARVMIAIAEGVVRRSAAFAYGLPLLALFSGVFIGSTIAGESGAIVGAISGLVLAWMGLHFVNRLHSPDQRFQPYIRN